MSDTLVMGLGPVGRAAMEALAARGTRVRVAQRNQPKDLPTGVGFTSCDVLDADTVRRALDGVDRLVLAIGFPYDGKVWREAWPKAMRNVVAAAEAASTRVVFVDNMYMLGPQDAALTEDMPLTSQGVKPAARAEVTRIWRAAVAACSLRFVALRCPDFYGPGVGLSHIGDTGFGRLAQGKAAMLVAPPDTPHDFAYVPDIARAVLSLLDAPDDAYGQAWNMPCAPTRTPREILALGAAALGVKPKVQAIPLGLLPALGLAVPFLREVAEMRFLFDRPYRVDARKFEGRFWSDVTPFEVGAAATARSFR